MHAGWMVPLTDEGVGQSQYLLGVKRLDSGMMVSCLV